MLIGGITNILKVTSDIISNDFTLIIMVYDYFLIRKRI